MNEREELEKSKAELQEILSGGPYTSALEAAVSAIEAQLAAMEPNVWIPPAGMIIRSDDDVVYESKGSLTDDGYLYVVPDGFISIWSRIPGLAQFTKHDGSDVCPCENRGVIVIGDEGGFSQYAYASSADWTEVLWWMCADFELGD